MELSPASYTNDLENANHLGHRHGKARLTTSIQFMPRFDSGVEEQNDDSVKNTN